MQYLYQDGEDFVFMDLDTFEQITGARPARRRERELPAARGRGHGRHARGRPALHRAADQRLPRGHLHRAGLQGDRSTGGTKPATVETGATVNVPLFITTGEKIKVDTRDGRYLGRS
jgi:elongation factor P